MSVENKIAVYEFTVRRRFVPDSNFTHVEVDEIPLSAHGDTYDKALASATNGIGIYLEARDGRIEVDPKALALMQKVRLPEVVYVDRTEDALVHRVEGDKAFIRIEADLNL